MSTGNALIYKVISSPLAIAPLLSCETSVAHLIYSLLLKSTMYKIITLTWVQEILTMTHFHLCYLTFSEHKR